MDGDREDLGPGWYFNFNAAGSSQLMQCGTAALTALYYFVLNQGHH